MTEDIHQFVRSCERCQLSNVCNKPPPSSLHPVAVHDLFHRWGIDLVGPMKESPRGMKYIAVATEYLTRWVEVAPIPDKTADSVHGFLLDIVFRFGACDVLLHDQGREFCNSLVGDLCQKMGTDEARTSAYHPQTNG